MTGVDDKKTAQNLVSPLNLFYLQLLEWVTLTSVRSIVDGRRRSRLAITATFFTPRSRRPSIHYRHHLLPMARFIVYVAGGRCSDNTGRQVRALVNVHAVCRRAHIYVWTLAVQTNDQRVHIIVSRPRTNILAIVTFAL